MANSADIKHKLLILDDELEILNSLKRVFRKSYDVVCCDNGEEALDELKKTQFAVIVSDMRMPQMSGAEFLTKAHAIAPDTVRILLTGFSDMDTTLQAINEGHIFSYVTKPWNNDELKTLVSNAVQHFDVVAENKRLTSELQAKNEELKAINRTLEDKVRIRTTAYRESNQRLKQSVKKQRTFFHNLIDMINLIIEDRLGDSKGHHKRVASHCRLVGEKMRLDRTELRQLYLGALLHELGKVAVCDELLQIPMTQLDMDQKRQYLSHAVKGAEILAKAEDLTKASEIVRCQYEEYGGTGFPDQLANSRIPVGARILRVVNDFDELALGRINGKNSTPEEAVDHLKENKKTLYDPEVVDIYSALMKELPECTALDFDFCISTGQLKPGMTLARSITYRSGKLMLMKETELTELTIDKLKQYEKKTQYNLSIFVY